MSPIKTMINGLPGNVTQIIARHAAADPRLRLLPFSLTGPEITERYCRVGDTDIELIKPADREKRIAHIMKAEGDFISVDFTHPSAVTDNARFYCRHGLPFVMGTTGGNRAELMEIVSNSSTAAVIAPNMAKQIVGLQAMMAYAAEQFPDLFKGYTLTIRESHQAGKADTSGTAKAMVEYFNRMGVDFHADRIQMERDPERQRAAWGIPEQYLGGHGWHTYTLDSADGTTRFEFTHNINGREIYGEGTLDAVIFLKSRIDQGAKGAVYSMIDVMKGGYDY